MKCELCKIDADNLTDVFNERVCNECRADIEDGLDASTLRGLFIRKGFTWIYRECAKWSPEDTLKELTK